MPNLEGASDWVLAIAATLWLVFGFVRWFLEWQAKRTEKAAAEDDKRKRDAERTHLMQVYERKLKEAPDTPVPPPPPGGFGLEQTGRHDIRQILEDDREKQELGRLTRETRQLAEQNAATMDRISVAIEGQGVLMEKLVDAVEKEQQSHDAIIGTLGEMGRAVVVLTRRIDQHEQEHHRAPAE